MINKSPKVSVVCAWYNRASYIEETIDSLLAQDYSNFDITVVNDGSPDKRVCEILDSYDDPRLRVINQENTGFTRAIRRAIDESDGQYIALQGAGDVSLPGRLAAQVAYLQQRQDYAIVGCRYVNQLKGPCENGAYTMARVRTLQPTAEDIMRGNPFGHGEVLMRRSAYNEVGGYRNFFENSQDKDLWLRISKTHRLGIVEASLYQRRIFLFDGIASSFDKTLKQIAYSRIADLCHQERQRGEHDTVERYGQLSLMRVPRGWRTTWRIVKAVRQLQMYKKRLTGNEIRIVGSLFGLPNQLIALIMAKLF